MFYDVFCALCAERNLTPGGAAAKIGFNRAARIMDQLAEAGVVSEESSTRARQVLMTMPEFEAFLESENG